MANLVLDGFIHLRERYAKVYEQPVFLAIPYNATITFTACMYDLYRALHFLFNLREVGAFLNDPTSKLFNFTNSEIHIIARIGLLVTLRLDFSCLLVHVDLGWLIWCIIYLRVLRILRMLLQFCIGWFV